MKLILGGIVACAGSHLDWSVLGLSARAAVRLVRE
jgi:hypothetical protein